MQIVCDIDGTLADASHRLHLLPARAAEDLDRPTEEDWAAFMDPELVAKDGHIAEVWRTVRGLLNEVGCMHPLLIFTGRRESLRDVTVAWLRAKADLFGIRPHIDRSMLLMRDHGDRRASWQVKRDHVEAVRILGHRPTIAFEDRAKDAAMYREAGLVCFQVAEGRY